MAIRYFCKKTSPDQVFANGKDFKYEYDYLASSVDDSYVCSEDSTATVEGVVIDEEIDFEQLPFSEKKRYRCQEVKLKDDKIRGVNGFTFVDSDDNTVKFALTEHNIIEYESIKNSIDIMPPAFPIPDYSFQTYYLKKSDMMSFWATAQQAYLAVASTGQPYINAINAATNNAELDAVIDNR